jgi:hypothetical protein
MWCELQNSRNPNFNPYMVWRALFGCLEGAPLVDYGEFEATNFTAVLAWRNFYALNYADVFGGNPTAASTLGKGKDKKEEETNRSVAEGQPPPFNPTAEFFLRFFRDYQGQRYVYVDTDDVARQVAKHHSRGLRIRFPELLTTIAILSTFSSLTGDISLISEKDLHWFGHLDLVIASWPCQGMSMAENQNGLQDGRFSQFYDIVCVIRYLQTSQRRPPGYIVKNVPVVSSSRSRTLESMHKIHGILGVPVLIDAAMVGSRAHRPHFWWTNLVPAELLQSAIGCTRQPDVYVSDILDPHWRPRRVYHDDQVPLAVVNRRGEPHRAFPTLVSFARSYAFKDNGPRLVWDSTRQEMVEPNVDERERAMGFPTSTTNVHGISEQQRRFLLDQAMDLNCLTWVVSLVVAEQRRLASTLIGHMGFYELRSAMEPPHLVTRPRKVVGGERASMVHP